VKNEKKDSKEANAWTLPKINLKIKNTYVWDHHTIFAMGPLIPSYATESHYINMGEKCLNKL
jgi:hypothetical protein